MIVWSVTGPSGKYHNWQAIEKSQGVLDKTFTGTTTLPRYSEPGWHVSLFVTDKLANETDYKEANLISMGFPHIIDVN